ncbi:tRNA uridine-5-carboxymethylaminomethyl(34) synthesis GTPase MnmE [Kiloniella laminariae]|uniref:tRNA uridine-5-carboxymethylaminomethyl(34) synthesis GTPase MnmE n=1 Tax=Kiloniella laminariae TaxID=454162 RepID=UPI0004768177|nr:tRNA uridine-5-carboxymethylaminomethyl(34) synthesis GTPase MnmE [Kiloniella laminariae]
MASDTIYALSTAPGQAGVAVIRISGRNAGMIWNKMTSRQPEPRTASLVKLADPEDASEIDRCLALWFPAPASFTGEDVVELHLHGGRAVVNGAISGLAKLPEFRPAEAGEFTRRAFANDKLDLTEVEGLSDLIAAETEAQRKQAIRQMDGELSRLIGSWREKLVRTLAYLEAEIDFPDEELEEGISEQVKNNILRLQSEINQHLDDGHRFERLRDGFSIAIIGPPNAGKSSLLNALARREVAIVSDIAGTTRDVIEVHLDLAGYPVTLADTAGLRELEEASDNNIELEGMRRARLRAEAADFRLAVFDLAASQQLDPETLRLLERGDGLVVLNKTDKPDDKNPDLVAELSDFEVRKISAKTGTGIDELIKRLTDEVVTKLGSAGASVGITRERHRKSLIDTSDALSRSLLAPLPELSAEDLRLATRHLGRITGKVDVEDLLDVIFRDFCIGK